MMPVQKTGESLMPVEEHDDELVMSLVESALDQPADARDSFLRSVCPDEGLRELVRTRVRWEERMGRFLLDPLLQRAPATTPFQASAVVAGRFRILREVGFGGMGVVYEAEDTVLDRRVALKCSKPGHRERLPPEVRAAREVSHFNVCKVYDLHVVPTPAGEVEFLSMEFIDGETLSGKIRRDGSLAPAEALSIAKQICAGLAQAHKQGVVHGDLKTGNVLLSKAPDGSVRAVITDFGLAKLAQSGGSSIMSGRGGTFDYMAPELLLGERSSVASDIYALGVLFHNLLTGHSPDRIAPQEMKAAVQVAAKQLQPISPDDSTATIGIPIRETDWHRKIDAIPATWKKVIKQCMVAKPAARYRTTEEVARDLEPRRLLLKSVAAIGLISTAGLGYWQWNEIPTGPPVRLAVLPFSADAGLLKSAAGVDTEVAERLSGARRNFSVILPREAQQNQVDSSQKAKTILGATHALRTRLTESGGSVVAEAALVDVESGRTVTTLKGTYGRTDMATLAKALVGTVTSGFHLKSRLPSEAVNDKAYGDYVQAVDLIRRDTYNADEAMVHLNKAIQLDPRSPLPYAALADALVQKVIRGDSRDLLVKAGDALNKAKSINPDCVPVLLSEGNLEMQYGRYEKAVTTLTRATELDPGSAPAWRRLAAAYERSNRTEDAVATFRKAVAAQPNGYAPYFDFANYYFARGEYRQAEELFRKVTTLAPDFPSGHTNLGLAYAQEGRFAEAEKELQHSLQLRKSTNVLLNLGAVYYAEERYEAALDNFREVLATSVPSAVRYRNLGDAYRHLGQKKEADDAYQKARALTEQEVTGNPRQGPARARLAYLSAYLGDRRTAEFEISQALTLEPENAAVLREAAKTFEALKEGDRALAALNNAPRILLEEISRQPDVKELRQDPQFQELLKSKSIQ
jgi:eukaryotic-like serine/threonine-protein kinase